MTHYSAMIAKLSPIDSAVALKPRCGRGRRVFGERKEERKRGARERECVSVASRVFQLCLTAFWQWVSHCEEVEPSHFLLLEQQQPARCTQSCSAASVHYTFRESGSFTSLSSTWEGGESENTVLEKLVYAVKLTSVIWSTTWGCILSSFL